MVARRVRTGARYIYNPVLFDRLHPPFGCSPGDVVTVVALLNCPRPNTMGMCHIAYSGRFAGMVMTNSLTPIRSARKADTK